MRIRLEKLVDEMLDGQILLDEAVREFEKVFIQRALQRHDQHLSNTAQVLGIHRNTLSKRVADYGPGDHTNGRKLPRSEKRIAKRAGA